MRTFILAAAFALAAAPLSTAAFAGEGQGNPFPFVSNGVTTAQVAVDTGSEETPAFGRTFATVTNGGLVLPNATNELVQSANSLPATRAATASSQTAVAALAYVR